MATIQTYPEELDYVNAKLHPMAKRVGSFLNGFLGSCLAADSDNYELVRPALTKIMEKYPAEPYRLWMERHDRGIDEPSPPEE